MPYILPNILSLIQYISALKNIPETCRPDKCVYCGRAHPHSHAEYERKSDRENQGEDSLNPILIQRYYCPGCGKTMSVLPECIPPKCWYLWKTQQIALVLIMSGHSLCAIAKEIIPSRHTIARWKNRFFEQHRCYKDVLCNQIPELGRSLLIEDFWSACLDKMTLGAAMRLCHVAGVIIP